MKEHAAQRIVNAILAELSGRGGFDLIGSLQSEDPETYLDLYKSCVKVTLKASRSARDATILGDEDSVQGDLYFPANYDSED